MSPCDRRPQAGAEIGVDLACTMGFIVKGFADLPLSFLTASHCETSHGSIGNAVTQHGVGRVVGAVSENTSFNVWHPSCGMGYTGRCTWADVIVVQMASTEWVNAIDVGHTRWVTPGASQYSDHQISGYTIITDEVAPYIGMGITRVGRITGTTRGTVDTMGTTGQTV